MRSNLPVTQREFAFPSGRTLVSVTDTKGRIIYGNAAFISVSGFASEELMGQAHNLVRHPDMPEEAFRDMWDTIQGGLPWTGVVKNRRKTGDHYWVRANVTPMVDGERVVGYLSVRSEAARSEIDAAEALYKRMRDEEAAGRLSLALHHGQVVRAGWLGRAGLTARAAFEAVGGLSVLYLPLALGLLMAAAAWLPLAGQVALVLALAPALGWLHHRSARQAVSAVARDALLLAACDLSHVPAQGAAGAIGQLQLCLAQLAVNLRTVVQDSRTDMENVKGAVMEITAGNQDLSSRTESQASSLEQTAASMEQITGTVKQSADSAHRGAQLAAETAEVSQRSFDAVAQVASAMGGIHDSARRMGDIIQVIEGVAFQTNILALNAAVEAARAGEAGRGFAVVATEVRALAHRTADAAKQIRQLITESSTRVAAGGAQVAEANARMTEALAAVNSVRDVLGEISTSSGEQQLGISQVNEAVAHMDAMTQQNAAMVEQLAAAASSVNVQVENVTNTMRLFRLKAGDVSIAEIDAVALRVQSKASTTDSSHGGAQAEEGIDLRQAIVKHMEWKSTLRAAASRGEVLDVATIRRDDCCMLGQWLHGERSQRWHGQAQFVALVDHHKQFHLAAAAVAETISSGQKEQGVRMMDGGTRFAIATQAVVVAIKGMMREVETRQRSGAGRAPAPGTRTAMARSPAAGRAPVASAASPRSSAAGDDWETF